MAPNKVKVFRHKIFYLNKYVVCRRDGMLVCGSMARPRQIEVWSTVGGDLRLSAQLTGEALGSVASIVDIHPSSGVVAGGNSSGRCHVFM